ncbi:MULTISPECIES: GNAT family N-acetyltransferase [unclassified Paracoccus (in: a-proteobacteria)]|uniref:GNAT family N-acetyltransferase n=1 Tax=unclassified Paracoccus (in: a-proteobacteria) TaxID=2688777 RepID=UPI0012B36E03|nr:MULTISPECIES: GNAT family protein [unclassified Paracoccus (in: a-proteobacteria)]UXU74029.1 GNAT family N-acetyltransferase [Paracoccus sp. SMMA_5]UXU79917.1 GNAT family N-acetyltransferase [Paracoccus sp. SMMA_5_TC]
MFGRRRPLLLETERMVLRLPAHADFAQWVALRVESREFLTPWEPVWAADHLSRRSFTNRVYWAQRARRNATALPLFLMRRDGVLLGAITLDNIRRGPAQSATIGYWIGRPHARQGYMREAIAALVQHAFGPLDLSRIEAACLPENTPSRGVLEKSGFKYEGVAQSYLQINGRWRNHVLYANLRNDRRGKTEVR